jgi:hypothetical protein
LIRLPLLRWKHRSRATSEGRLRRVLHFPLPSPARIAILDDGFTAGRNSRQFHHSELRAIQQWAPEAIVAPLETSLSLADQKLRGLVGLTSLRMALVVLTDINGELLDEDYRRLLWQAFGVPIFEQLRGPDCNVIARECEVHDGLHVDLAAHVTPELSLDLVNEQC